MISIGNIIDILKNHNVLAVPDVLKAYKLAESAHSGVLRESGDPYITHPLNVALNLLNMKVYDGDTICAALLHDVVEDTDVTLEDIANEINPTVAELVDGVTKMRGMNYTKQESELANTRKILNGLNKDVRIIIIKLADRLHNMSTLGYKKNLKRQKEIAEETRDLYVPLALSIGAYRTKKELEDLSLKHIEPGMYQDIHGRRAELVKSRQPYMNEIEKRIRLMLKDRGIECDVSQRVLNIYGIYKKIEQGFEIENIIDVSYMKVLVDEIDQCYQALGVVHRLGSPINGRFKDYIGMPKTNFYRSLHTTVIINTINDILEGISEIVKFKIRTFDMDDVAAFGVSSVWNIKENKKEGEMPRRMSIDETQEEIRTRLQFATTLQELDVAYKTDAEFIRALNQELLATEHIYVSTVSGRQIELPVGSNVFDLAAITDPELIDQLTGAVINGKDQKITTVLRNGDVVQIKTTGKFDPNTLPYDQLRTQKGRQKLLTLMNGQKA